MKIVIVFALVIALACDAAPVEKPGWRDFRIEYIEALLYMNMIPRFKQFEDLILKMTEQTRDLGEAKTKDAQGEIKKQILNEMAEVESFFNSMTPFLERQLKRTTLNLSEKIHYQAMLALGTIVHKEFNTLAAQFTVSVSKK